jgi:hypothetical protein
MNIFKKGVDLIRRDTLDSIPEETKSMRVGTKSFQLMNKIKKEHREKSSPNKEVHINNMTVEVRPNSQAGNQPWMQNASGMVLPISYYHRLKQEYIMYNMVRATFK